MSGEPESGQDPLDSFEGQLKRDEASGDLKPLESYLEAFPGNAETIAESYLTHKKGAFCWAGPESSDRVGDYEIERELGRGGQGVVYLAKDTRLNRQVALKVLTSMGHGSEDSVRRFRREATVASKLEHPGICGVYEAGTTNGMPFIAMRYVEGESLAARLSSVRTSFETESDASIIDLSEVDDDEPAETTRDAPSPVTSVNRDEVRRVLKIFEDAARALHAAHEAGILHRDIKPGNIMVTPDGRPVILDFGMARDDDDDDAPSLTQSGDLFGTPAYMSPEQLTGQRIILDRRTDIWSLAVSLFECLTLEKPFESPTRQGVYQAVIGKEMPDPRKQNPAIPPDLKVILETALDKDRDRRYQTALELADELRRARLYEPILARPAGVLLRLRRWAQRNPALATSSAALLVLLITAHTLLTYGLGAADKAEIAEQLATKTRAERDRIAEEGRVLAQRAADERILRQVEELTLAFALMSSHIGGEFENFRLVRDYLDAFRDYGLALDADEPIGTIVARLHALKDRDPKLWRDVLSGIHGLEWVLHGKGLTNVLAVASGAPPAGAREAQVARWREIAEQEPGLLTASRRIANILEEAETDPGHRSIRAAIRRFKKSRDPREYDDLVSADETGSLDAEAMGWLGIVLCDVKSRGDEGFDLLRRSLQARPDDFVLHFARAGMGLDDAMRKRRADKDDPVAEKAAAVALHHAQVAVALRPGSGMAWCLVASAYAINAQIREALTAIKRSTAQAPDSAVVWLMNARFYAFTPQKHKAIAACRRALELDPSMQKARELLTQLETGKSGNDR